jgi:Protein of unknown function (DUF2786)
MTEELSNTEAVVKRVAKLLSIAGGTGNAREAAAAAGMAERVMRKYQIEHADVIAQEMKAGGADQFGSEDVGSTLNTDGRSTSAAGWAGTLACSVADLHSCQARYMRTEKHGKAIRFSGYKSDAQCARYTYIYLVSAMVSACKAWANDRAEGGYPQSRRETEAFRRGFVFGMTDAIQRLIKEKKSEMEATSDGRGLMIVKAAAVAQHFGNVKYTSGSRQACSASFYSGRAMGARVDVGRRGVGSSGSAVMAAALLAAQ